MFDGISFRVTTVLGKERAFLQALEPELEKLLCIPPRKRQELYLGGRIKPMGESGTMLGVLQPMDDGLLDYRLPAAVLDTNLAVRLNIWFELSERDGFTWQFSSHADKEDTYARIICGVNGEKLTYYGKRDFDISMFSTRGPVVTITVRPGGIAERVEIVKFSAALRNDKVRIFKEDIFSGPISSVRVRRDLAKFLPAAEAAMKRFDESSSGQRDFNTYYGVPLQKRR